MRPPRQAYQVRLFLLFPMHCNQPVQFLCNLANLVCWMHCAGHVQVRKGGRGGGGLQQRLPVMETAVHCALCCIFILYNVCSAMRLATGISWGIILLPGNCLRSVLPCNKPRLLGQ